LYVENRRLNKELHGVKIFKNIKTKIKHQKEPSVMLFLLKKRKDIQEWHRGTFVVVRRKL